MHRTIPDFSRNEYDYMALEDFLMIVETSVFSSEAQSSVFEI